MSDEPDLYLIWSHEHGAWWGPDERGYVQSMSAAGRYSHAHAMAICIRSIPGTSRQLGALPELPVRLIDALTMQVAFRTEYPSLPREDWE